MKISYSHLFNTLAISTVLGLTACSKNAEDTQTHSATEVVTIVATDTKPYSSLMEQAKKDLKAQNIDLQITYMSDPLSINRVVAEKQYDLNYYQHEAYLDSVRFKNQWDLEPISYTFNTIFGGYSSKYKALDDLPTGAVVSIPGDPANNARALELLADSNLITLKPHAADYQVSQRDISSNPKQLKIVEVEQPMLPKAYQDSDLTVITGVYADRAGLVPNRDALIQDKAAKQWTAVLVANSESAKKSAVIKVKDYFDSKTAYDFIQNNYNQFVIWNK
jgi:D-methionine transport system substrate-binding protein